MLAYRAKRVLSEACLRVLGRRNTVRLSRFILNEARRDVPNDMSINGESALQRAVCAASAGGDVVVMDVGANVGDWSRSLLREARAAKLRSLTLHAFEAAPDIAKQLRATLLAPLGQQAQITVHDLGVSSQEGTASFFLDGPGSGTNSLVQRSVGEARQTRVIDVQLTTIDSYCASTQLAQVTLCKTDVEGHDYEVMLGAARSFAEQRIGVWQFEYNWRWISARRFLRDVFEFAAQHGYKVGKVTQQGIEFYETWDEELESFREANYVLCRADWYTKLPKVRWWKAV